MLPVAVQRSVVDRFEKLLERTGGLVSRAALIRLCCEYGLRAAEKDFAAVMLSANGGYRQPVRVNRKPSTSAEPAEPNDSHGGFSPEEKPPGLSADVDSSFADGATADHD